MPTNPGDAQFPGALPTAITLFDSVNSPTTTSLNGGISDVDTVIVLTSAAAYPNTGAIKIGSEIIYYNGKASNTLTAVTRGADGTVAAAHLTAAAVRMVNISRMREVQNDEIIAIATKLGTGSSTAAANKVLNGTGAGVSAWTATPTLDRQYIAPSALSFDLLSSVLAVGHFISTAADITVATGKVYDHIRLSKTDGNYSVFDIAGTGIVSGLNFQLQAKAGSGASTALYGTIGALSNAGAGATKAIYGRAVAETGCTGTIVGLVGAVSAISGVTAWIVQLAGTDNTDFAIRIHADNLTSANFNGGIEFDKNVRVESGGAFYRAYQTAAHDGDFLSYLTQADAVLFKVDKDGLMTAPSNALSQASIANLGKVRVATVLASSQATVDFTTLDDTYDAYELVVSSAKPATDDVEAWLRIGTGAGPTYQTSGYVWGLAANPMGAANSLYGSSAGGSTARIVMSEVGAGVAVGNATGENWSGTIWFNNPEATDFMELRYDAQYSRSSANQSVRVVGGGRFDTAGAVTGIRFMFSSGNVASGRFTLYGYRKS
jgi:hypothetical protein